MNRCLIEWRGFRCAVWLAFCVALALIAHAQSEPSSATLQAPISVGKEC
jgi:hypothetical protein